MAFVATALFFCSLLLHELGHALQARREGIAIEGITLWLFGDEVPVLDEDEEAVDALGELSDASSKRGLVLSGEGWSGSSRSVTSRARSRQGAAAPASRS